MSVERSDRLREVLREWAEHDAAEYQAPQEVPALLLTAFRSRQRAAAMRRRWAAVAGAVAAAGLLAAALMRFGQPGKVPPAATSRLEKSVSPPMRPEPVQAAVRLPAAKARTVKKARRKQLLPAPPVLAQANAALVETMTEFYPIAGPEGNESLGNSAIIRVELPRTALAMFGLPVNEQRISQRVKADLLLGEDGTARAVRFIQ